MLLEKIREFKTKLETQKLYEELANRKTELMRENIANTLRVIANYLVQDQLERTGLLYSPEDDYIQTEMQKLFWEWKREGIINEFENFDEYTWNWIKEYS